MRNAHGATVAGEREGEGEMIITEWPTYVHYRRHRYFKDI